MSIYRPITRFFDYVQEYLLCIATVCAVFSMCIYSVPYVCSACVYTLYFRVYFYKIELQYLLARTEEHRNFIDHIPCLGLKGEKEMSSSKQEHFTHSNSSNDD